MSYNSRSNRARNFKSASRFAIVRCWNYSRDYSLNSQLQKRESTGASFLYWLDWKSKHSNWNVNKWKATQPRLRVFGGKLSKWERCKSCKFPYKPLDNNIKSSESMSFLRPSLKACNLVNNDLSNYCFSFLISFLL